MPDAGDSSLRISPTDGPKFPVVYRVTFASDIFLRDNSRQGLTFVTGRSFSYEDDNDGISLQVGYVYVSRRIRTIADDKELTELCWNELTYFLVSYQLIERS